MAWIAVAELGLQEGQGLRAPAGKGPGALSVGAAQSGAGSLEEEVIITRTECGRGETDPQRSQSPEALGLGAMSSICCLLSPRVVGTELCEEGWELRSWRGLQGQPQGTQGGDIQGCGGTVGSWWV